MLFSIGMSVSLTHGRRGIESGDPHCDADQHARSGTTALTRWRRTAGGGHSKLNSASATVEA